jgi:hypothetical protein
METTTNDISQYNNQYHTPTSRLDLIHTTVKERINE